MYDYLGALLLVAQSITQFAGLIELSSLQQSCYLILMRYLKWCFLRDGPLFGPELQIHSPGSPVNEAFVHLTGTEPVHQCQGEPFIHKHPFPYEKLG